MSENISETISAENISAKTRKIQLPFESVDAEPYIFASYGHDNKEAVFPLLRQLPADRVFDTDCFGGEMIEKTDRFPAGLFAAACLFSFCFCRQK